jgi:hypothetical protein
MKSLKELAKDCGKLSQYQTFYASWSETTHGTAYGPHVQFDANGTVHFEALRKLTKFPELIRTSVAFAFNAYRLVLNEYRDGELPAYGRKYIENWKKAFMEIPRVNYSINHTGPAAGI